MRIFLLRIFQDRRFLLAPGAWLVVSVAATLLIWIAGSLFQSKPLSLPWALNLLWALEGPVLVLWTGVYVLVTGLIFIDTISPIWRKN
ncbi:hypothetical protein ACFO0J_02245 [Castellaniella hirudinis]|uniref:ABC transporter permease n=1 Tax=Castellaniella hirudinis TaxID=1144617 RepID=A0ABV8RWV5_9BURK